MSISQAPHVEEFVRQHSKAGAQPLRENSIKYPLLGFESVLLPWQTENVHLQSLQELSGTCNVLETRVSHTGSPAEKQRNHWASEMASAAGQATWFLPHCVSGSVRPNWVLNSPSDGSPCLLSHFDSVSSSCPYFLTCAESRLTRLVHFSSVWGLLITANLHSLQLCRWGSADLGTILHLFNTTLRFLKSVAHCLSFFLYI